jgi:hypothetical protein
MSLLEDMYLASLAPAAPADRKAVPAGTALTSGHQAQTPPPPPPQQQQPSPLDQQQLAQAIAVVQALADMSAPGFGTRPLYVPDERGVLTKAGELAFNDAPCALVAGWLLYDCICSCGNWLCGLLACMYWTAGCPDMTVRSLPCMAASLASRLMCCGKWVACRVPTTNTAHPPTHPPTVCIACAGGAGMGAVSAPGSANAVQTTRLVHPKISNLIAER